METGGLVMFISKTLTIKPYPMKIRSGEDTYNFNTNSNGSKFSRTGGFFIDSWPV